MAKQKKQPQLNSLFRHQHLNTQAITPLQWLVFVFYFPLGCVLSVLRIIIGVLVALITPSHLRPRLMRIISGFHVSSSQPMDMPQKGALLLSNHASYMDYAVVSAALSKQRYFATVIWHQVEFFIQTICRPVIPVHNAGMNRQFLHQLRQQFKRGNVLLFPEGATTDTCSGLLRFEKSAFVLKNPLYLVAIKYQRPFSFLQPKALSTNLVLEMAIELFQPWTRVKLTAIGYFPRLEAETPQAYAQRAQQRIADALQLDATNWTRHDRHQLLFPEDRPTHPQISEATSSTQQAMLNSLNHVSGTKGSIGTKVPNAP